MPNTDYHLKDPTAELDRMTTIAQNIVDGMVMGDGLRDPTMDDAKALAESVIRFCDHMDYDGVLPDGWCGLANFAADEIKSAEKTFAENLNEDISGPLAGIQDAVDNAKVEIDKAVKTAKETLARDLKDAKRAVDDLRGVKPEPAAKPKV